MKPTLEWCNAAVAELGDGAILGGGSSPDQPTTYVVAPVRMSSPADLAIETQLVTSQVDVVCYAQQKQEARVVDKTREVWARVREQVERIHQLGAMNVDGVLLAAPVACDYQVAEPGEQWYIAATVSIELFYMRALVTGA